MRKIFRYVFDVVFKNSAHNNYLPICTGNYWNLKQCIHHFDTNGVDFLILLRRLSMNKNPNSPFQGSNNGFLFTLCSQNYENLPNICLQN
jgi:hypothetical protein